MQELIKSKERDKEREQMRKTEDEIIYEKDIASVTYRWERLS